MRRKTYLTGFAGIAGAAAIGIASAETPGTYAQLNAEVGAEAVSIEEPLTQEVVPVFVSEEVVQPLPPVEATPEPAFVPEAESLSSLIGSVDTPETLSREMKCLAGTVYFEARGEPVAGQLGVAQVVINRSESATFPSSYCGVVYQRNQFSFVRGGQMPTIRKSSAAWTRAKKIARIAHEGLWESRVGDLLYFHANYVSPKWSRSKSRRAAIKTHIFYR